MNRRGHLSSKIPNVKLRPAPATAGATRTRGNNARSPSPLTGMDAVIQQREMEGEEDEEMSTAALRQVSRPWKNVVITFTGVDRKNELSRLANELGAKVDNALTVHVTHVVAISVGSDKYKYAVEHRIPVLTPAWIEENHNHWLHGQEVEESVDSYRLPPFLGLIISMSGIEPIERRKQIVAAVNAHGGRYSKDLTRECTHLISAKPTSQSKSSEKVQWAVKELRDRSIMRRRGAKTEGVDMRIVYEEWLWDCVAFHGRFNEDGYDAHKRPRPTPKVKAEDVLDGTAYQLQAEAEALAKEALVKKDEAAGGGDDEGPAVLRKRKRDDLVGELISTASAALKPEAHAEAEEQADSMVKGGAVAEAEAGPSRPSRPSHSSELRKASLLHATRTASFGLAAAPDVSTPSMPPSMPRPTSAELLSNANADPVIPQIFAGLRFSHLIDEGYDGLERALVAHGGEVVSEQQRLAGEQVDRVIVRLSLPRTPDPVDGIEPPVVLTECWVEGCCFEQSLLPVDKHLVFQPLPAPMPVVGTASLAIHLSGLSVESSTYLRRLIRVIGATQAVSLNKQTTHLVSGKNEGPKVDKAREWGVKVVSEAWLLAIGRSGSLVPEDEYPLGQTPSTITIPTPAPTSQVSQSRELRPTPTHIDRSGAQTVTASGPAAFPPSVAASAPSANPLSPPHGESARKLNHASTSAIPNISPSDNGSAASASKLSRAGSAAPASGSGKDMTEALRLLAERGDATPILRPKAPRRSKNGLQRARTSLATTPEHFTPEPEPETDAGLDNLPANPIYEESMRVSVADPAADRERRRMLDGLRRTSGVTAVGRGR